MNNLISELLKTLLFIVILHFLFKYELFDIFSVACCNNESSNTEVSSFFPSYVLRTTTVFSGSMLILRSMPLQTRTLTCLGIAVSQACFTAGRRVSNIPLKSKIANETLKSTGNNGFKASSIIEENWDMYFQFEYFILLVCFSLITLAFFFFTVIVLWVIAHKYNSFVVFLTEKTQSKLFFTIIEKIKKISALKIIYLVFFVYISLFICVYLLLTCF